MVLPQFFKTAAFYSICGSLIFYLNYSELEHSHFKQLTKVREKKNNLQHNFKLKKVQVWPCKEIKAL